MPYRRRKRRTFKRRRRGKGFRRAVNAVVRKSLEHKSKVVTFSNLAIPAASGASSATDIDFTDIAQGLDTNNRVGRNIRVTGFFLKGFLTNYDASNAYRLILYIPKDENTSLSNAPALGYNEIVDEEQYTILLDKWVATSDSGVRCKPIQMKFRFKGRGMKIDYRGSAGSDCVGKHLYLYLVSDSGVASHPTLNGEAVMWYTDA